MPDVKVYGANWCPDCRRAKKFLGEQRVPYDWIDVEQDPRGLRLVEEINKGKQIIPTILFPDGSVLVEPTNAELAEKLGLVTRARVSFYDLIVVGSGPAGLTAALYAAREGLETLVIERSGVGGQAGLTERLDNFPGFPEGVSGGDFADRLRQQAERFGVEILVAQDVREVGAENRHRVVRTASGEEYCAPAVLLTPGSTYRRLEVPGEDDFIGAGVHFCATCDGPFYKGREVMVIGGGNSATEESLFLLRFSPKVTLVTIAPELTASQILRQKVSEKPEIEVVYNTTVKEFRGNGRLSSVVLRNVETGGEREESPAAVFVFIGMKPNTDFLAGAVDLDQWGFIATGPGLETSLPGVFAAGDVRAGSTKQAAAAAGEGATAALMIRAYLNERATSAAD